MNCPCVQNEDGETVVFCRDCAMNLPQRLEDGSANPDWIRARLGKLTSSGISHAGAKNRQGTGPGVTQLDYLARLTCERLTGIAYEGFHNSYMDRGNATEPEAVAEYEFRVGVAVRSVGFVHHRNIPEAGASPDGLVDEDGQLEVKCRKTHLHIDLLNARQIPTPDLNQILFALACTGRAWCDYVSYDPRVPVGSDLFVRRVYRDDYERRIAELESLGAQFLEAVARQTREIKERAADGFIFLNRDYNGHDLTSALTASIEMAAGVKTKRRS